MNIGRLKSEQFYTARSRLYRMELSIRWLVEFQ